MRREKAFTLVELLVVISIIALLLSILLPALNKAKEQAKLSVCMSNMKQLGYVFKVYLADNEDRFFYRDDTVRDDIGPINWFNLFDFGDGDYSYGGADPHTSHCGVRFPQAMIRPFYQYVKDFEGFHCPADRGEEKTYPCDYWKPSNFFAVGTSYRYNYDNYLLGNPTQKAFAAQYGIANKKESWVPHPSRYILLHESPALKLGYYGGAYYLWHFARGETTVIVPDLARSPFISNILFVDGHAGTFDFTDTFIDPTTGNANDYICEPTADWVWYKPGIESAKLVNPTDGEYEVAAAD